MRAFLWVLKSRGFACSSGPGDQLCLALGGRGGHNGAGHPCEKPGSCERNARSCVGLAGVILHSHQHSWEQDLALIAAR